MKIAVVTCYKHNDYIRARTLRTAVLACSDAEPLVIRNRYRGLLRYPEVFLKLIWLRLVQRPDAYVLPFRAYETLLFMRLTLVRKPIIFDEMVNFVEWMEEHDRLSNGSLPFKLFRGWNRWLVKRCRFILADTDAHAKKSAILNKSSIERYRVMPVCADESVFHASVASNDSLKKPFTVLYYGTMLPLHGVEHVIAAAKLLRDRPEIQFRFVGGKNDGKLAKACAEAVAAGAQVSHEGWMPLEDLPKGIHQAGLVLGGPFGNTEQSQYVITGKTYQALATAAPVVIGKNQVNEGFTDKKNCLMVAQADAQALADAISWAAENQKELTSIARAGSELYERHFSQQVVNEVVADMIGEL